MDIIIEYEKISSNIEYSSQLIKNPKYIAISHDHLEGTYCLIYNETEFNIDKAEVNDLLETLNLVKINKVPEDVSGVDGESYTVRIGNSTNSVRFNWWSDSCGEQWEGFFIFREKILKLRDKYVKYTTLYSLLSIGTLVKHRTYFFAISSR